MCLSASLKTQHLCETSSIFELGIIKNETILPDFLNFRSWQWQQQKRSNSARLPSKMESWVQSWRPRTNAFCDFSTPPSKVLRLPRESDAGSYEVLQLSRKIISANLKIWCSKMQPVSGNQRSDEHVSCTVPATENASLQIFFKCPTLAMVSGNATKPSRFAHFWFLTRCTIAPAAQNSIWTSKSAPNPSVFCTLDFEMCFAPQRRALFRHHNF